MLKANLEGRRALVTGSGSGIGLATATLLRQCGAIVAGNYLPGDNDAKSRIENIDENREMVFGVPGDVADADDADRMVEEATTRLGGLDILINNAGTSATVNPIPFEDLDAMTEERWQKILSTNLIGPFRVCKAASSHLTASKGVIVNVASIAGLGGNASSLAYGASKAGLINLTRNLAKAFGPHVNVNAVAPGLTRTPWTENWPEERKQRSVANTMLKRMVEAQDVAETILFLCIQRAITGQVVQVDCGRQF